MSLMSHSQESKSLKVILIGDGGTGKTSLANRFIHKTFSSIYKTTIGVDISPFNTVARRTQRPIRFVLWDMSGQTHFKRFRARFYSGTSGAIVVYDLSNAQSYRNVQSWIKECHDNIHKPIPLILLGNKSDLTDQRAIPTERGKELSTKIKASHFIETSAKFGENIEEAFSLLVNQILSNYGVDI